MPFVFRTKELEAPGLDPRGAKWTERLDEKGEVEKEVRGASLGHGHCQPQHGDTSFSEPQSAQHFLFKYVGFVFLYIMPVNFKVSISKSAQHLPAGHLLHLVQPHSVPRNLRTQLAPPPKRRLIVLSGQCKSDLVPQVCPVTSVFSLPSSPTGFFLSPLEPASGPFFLLIRLPDILLQRAPNMRLSVPRCPCLKLLQRLQYQHSGEAEGGELGVQSRPASAVYLV